LEVRKRDYHDREGGKTNHPVSAQSRFEELCVGNEFDLRGRKRVVKKKEGGEISKEQRETTHNILRIKKGEESTISEGSILNNSPISDHLPK